MLAVGIVELVGAGVVLLVAPSDSEHLLEQSFEKLDRPLAHVVVVEAFAAFDCGIVVFKLLAAGEEPVDCDSGPLAGHDPHLLAETGCEALAHELDAQVDQLLEIVHCSLVGFFLLRA